MVDAPQRHGLLVSNDLVASRGRKFAIRVEIPGRVRVERF